MGELFIIAHFVAIDVFGLKDYSSYKQVIILGFYST